MILSNANIFTRDGIFETGSVVCAGDKISKLDLSSNSHDDSFDCEGHYLIPGFIDIHFHGCAGHDFCEGTPEALDAISSYELKHGITSICPATMTYPQDILEKAMTNAANYKNEKGSEIVGINMEGPFISPEKVGAQNPKYVQAPDFEMLKQLDDSANGLIKLVDIAPEVDGASEFIKKAAKNFVISIAHTNCTYSQACEAYKLGAMHLTHTFNAMPPIHHRSPGPIVAASENNASAEIICDGQHVNYAAIRLAAKLFGDKMCLISDSCEATGLDDGEYSLGGQAILKRGNKVVLKNNEDTIAASVTNLYDCFCHAVKDAKINLEDAIIAASLAPAKAIGIDGMYGSIEPGKFANILIVDDNLKLINVIYKGKLIKS